MEDRWENFRGRVRRRESDREGEVKTAAESCFEKVTVECAAWYVIDRGGMSEEAGEPKLGRQVKSRGAARLGISSPSKLRQHRTLHTQKDVLPYALCQLLCPVSAALASIFRMDLISTSYRGAEKHLTTRGKRGS